MVAQLVQGLSIQYIESPCSEVNALTSGAKGPRFDPDSRQGKLRCPNTLSLVSFAVMTLNECTILQIGTLTGCPLCRESHPLCRLKNITVIYIYITCKLSSCNPEYTLPLMLVKASGSTERKKEKSLPFLCYMLAGAYWIWMEIHRSDHCWLLHDGVGAYLVKMWGWQSVPEAVYTVCLCGWM